MSEFRIIRLPSHGGDKGLLTVMEHALPFSVRRTYWITGADRHTRGGHRHRVTRQALVALGGEVLVHMDDGRHRRDLRLSQPDHCLIVEPEDWHTMTFGPGASLLVFASHEFDAEDYIDDGYTNG